MQGRDNHSTYYFRSEDVVCVRKEDWGNGHCFYYVILQGHKTVIQVDPKLGEELIAEKEND